LDDVRQLGVTTSLPIAAQILGICYPTARRLATSGKFPVPIARVGRRWKVPTEPLIALLTTGHVLDRTTAAEGPRPLAATTVAEREQPTAPAAALPPTRSPGLSSNAARVLEGPAGHPVHR
jgi:hypothetical protein